MRIFKRWYTLACVETLRFSYKIKNMLKDFGILWEDFFLENYIFAWWRNIFWVSKILLLKKNYYYYYYYYLMNWKDFHGFKKRILLVDPQRNDIFGSYLNELEANISYSDFAFSDHILCNVGFGWFIHLQILGFFLPDFVPGTMRLLLVGCMQIQFRTLSGTIF